IGRWGGEEFIIVIPGADKESLGEIAEKYRTLIRNTELVLEETTVSVSASIGGTLLNKADTISSAVKRADTLMYQSKAEGKDRVTLDS
ncbi:MAG: GGDEF domain-containing protein, partial [Elusimicrobia bacterium]|nr:GGDEF domain-containing protein [Elusimicrobiota bacterium]